MRIIRKDDKPQSPIKWYNNDHGWGFYNRPVETVRGLTLSHLSLDPRSNQNDPKREQEETDRQKNRRSI